MEGFKKMSEILGDQIAHGQRMGFKTGGSVDSGIQPANKDGVTEQEKEAGGTPKLKPGYKKGGKAARKGRKPRRTRTERELDRLGEGRPKKTKKAKGGCVEVEIEVGESEDDNGKEKKMRGGRMKKTGYKKGGYNSEPMVGK